MVDTSKKIQFLHRAFTVATCVRLVLLFSDVSLVSAAEAHAATAQSTISSSFQDVIPASELLQETNANRIEAGLSPLELNDQLTAAAEAKAQDMVINNYWDHFRPSDHKAPWDFIDEAGYHYQVAGENLARGFQTAGGITRAWMHSPAHAANILSPKYKEVGFATIYGTDDNGNSVILTVQMFGAR